MYLLIAKMNKSDEIILLTVLNFGVLGELLRCGYTLGER